MSGYDLRKVFEETALGNYSSSPGAIYPALSRLEQQGIPRNAVGMTMLPGPEHGVSRCRLRRETRDETVRPSTFPNHSLEVGKPALRKQAGRHPVGCSVPR